jgi:hypothetical protein
MKWRFLKRTPVGVMLSGAFLAVAGASAHGQTILHGGPAYPPPMVGQLPGCCPPSPYAPLPPPSGVPGTGAAPSTGAPSGTGAAPGGTGAAGQPGQPPQATEPQAPSLGQEQAASTTGETAGVGAPNMVGHLLFGTRSVTFNYNRAAGFINVANNGSTSIINPSVADDNSPLPRDRVGFRFNWFGNAQQVTGFGPAVLPTPGVPGVGTSFAQTRGFNVEEYNFNFEKTFLNDQASVELRIPFSTGLSSNLNLSAGDITGPVGGTTGPGFGVNPTPERTLGSNGTQFGNVTLILKGLAYGNSTLSVSGGLALGIPTGDDTTVHITDLSGVTTQGVATIQRDRTIHIDNETWSLSPFVAFLSTPTERLFTQGFVQVDFPLNDSTINYTEVFTRGVPPPPARIRFPFLTPPFSVRETIPDQTLLQLDWGTGYWLMKDPSRSWLTGIAPSVELHYTTTLNNAAIVTLPGDTLLHNEPPPPRNLVQEQPPRVGNLRNRMDILDITAATTFLLSDRATLATGVSFPLKGGADRTFDWEFHLQVNYYFGGFGRRSAPNF